MFVFLTDCFAARDNMLLAQGYDASLAGMPADEPAATATAQQATPEYMEHERISLAA